MVVPTRSRSTTQTPDTRKTGLGTSTTSRPANGTARTHGRTNSYASSTRTASTSRTTNGSHSATVGPGSRPASSLGFSRAPSVTSTRRYPGPTTPRATSALGTHKEEPDGTVKGKRKGTPQFSFPCSYGSPLAGLLPCDSMSPSSRPGLEYTPQPVPDGSPNHFVTKVPIPSTPARQSPSRPQSVRSKSPSKRNLSQELPFLTKDSTTRSFNHSIGAPFDYDMRMSSMEELRYMVDSRVNQFGQNSFSLMDGLDLYKTRGK